MRFPILGLSFLLGTLFGTFFLQNSFGKAPKKGPILAQRSHFGSSLALLKPCFGIALGATAMISSLLGEGQSSNQSAPHRNLKLRGKTQPRLKEDGDKMARPDPPGAVLLAMQLGK